jgi:hypothetical protein
MSSLPWTQEINFGSALLLHSCITVFLKENQYVAIVLKGSSAKLVLRDHVVYVRQMFRRMENREENTTQISHERVY